MSFEEKILKIRAFAAEYLKRAERERLCGDKEKAAFLLKDGQRLKGWAEQMARHFQSCG